MIAQSIGHSTGDEGIALAMNLCEESGRGIFHLARFLARREKDKAAAASAGTDPMISDACSGYRGGYTDTADPEMKTLLSDIIGKDSYKSISEKPFAFLGDGGDLSYFWEKDASEYRRNDASQHDRWDRGSVPLGESNVCFR